ncbi:MAG: hypothetical protein OEZ59_07170 [Deltaproteobacteria bacterium]|nr:hypothetical protein [Deltaproteobacteria bacterium]
MAVGLGIANYRNSLVFDYGLSSTGNIRGHYGMLEITGVSGAEFGVGYKHDLKKTFKAGQKDARLGAFGYFTSGEYGNEWISWSYTYLDLGVGFDLKPKKNLTLFGAGILSMFKAEFKDKNNSFWDSTYSSTDLGGMGGGELLVNNELSAGIQLKFGFAGEPDTFIIYGLYRL